ncbi:MAG: VWA domain-containing protein [Verrucomicrobiaceae bacterium]|nr:VWA domain-containing protein [Verrucomicrobiaceae bacterium]
MSKWLQLLGVDKDKIPEDAEIAFRFANLPESWGVFVLIAVVFLVAWFVLRVYRRENSSCPMWAKHLLAAFRLTVGAVLLFVFLEPSISYTKSRTLRPVLALLRDTSQSMNTADRYIDDRAASSAASVMGISVEELRLKKPSRVDVANRMFDKDEGLLLKNLAEKGRVRVFDFSGSVEAHDVPGIGEVVSEEVNDESNTVPMTLPAFAANGSATDITRAVREALSEKLTSALVVITDGQHNVVSDPEDAVQEARKRNIPVFFIGVGDPDRPQNLSVSNLYADPQVWNNDPFQIQAVLRAEGLSEDSVKVSLVELSESEGGEQVEKIIESKDVDIPAEGGQLRVDFSHTPKTPGEKLLTVRADFLEGESNIEDNEPSAPARVKVLDDNARVLVVSGGPSWEYRALVRLLLREKMINVSCWLQSLDDGRQQQGNTPINALPATREELFNYDVVVLLDPDPMEFDEDGIELLKQFVREHSGGLLYMPGPVFSGRFLTDARTAGISELLPVELGDVGSMEVSSLLSPNNREWPLAVVASNADQPIMRFFNDVQQTLMQWKKLPGTYWSFPALRAAPAARVLIEHSDSTLRRREIARPLLVTGQFGSGRTTYLGFDGTWRWRTKGLDAEFFKRFWIQTVRYLVEGRSLAGKRRGLIETERFRYQVGDRVRISARLKQQNFEPLAVEEVKGEMRLPDGSTSEVTFVQQSGQVGHYELLFAAALQGGHRVSVVLPGEVGEKIEIDSNFTVTLPLKEIQDAWLDRERLIDMASSSGGAYFNPDEVAGLSSALPDRVKNLAFESPPKPVWDNTALLVLLAGLLTLEWALRKKFRLL